MQLWVNDVFEAISRDDDVAAVSVHLNQLEVAVIKRLIQEIVIELRVSALLADKQRFLSGMGD